MNERSKRLKKKEHRLHQKQCKEIMSYAYMFVEYRKIYGSIWKQYYSKNFSIKTFRSRIKQLIKLKAFL